MTETYTDVERFLRSYYDDATLVDRAESTIHDLRKQLFYARNGEVRAEIMRNALQPLSSHIFAIAGREVLAGENMDRFHSVGQISATIETTPIAYLKSVRHSTLESFHTNLLEEYSPSEARTWSFWRYIAILEELLAGFSITVNEKKKEALLAQQRAKEERSAVKRAAAQERQRANRKG